MATMGGGVPQKRIAEVRGYVEKVSCKCAIIKTIPYGGARLDVASIRRLMNSQVDNLTVFMKTGDRVIVEIEPMKQAPARVRIGAHDWNVYKIRRDCPVSRPFGLSTPGFYMDMNADEIQTGGHRTRLQTTQTLVPARQILSIWNDVEVSTFINLWNHRSDVLGMQDANALIDVVRNLKHHYFDISGNKIRLYSAFTEEEIHDEMKQRFLVRKELHPRKQDIFTAVVCVRVVERVDVMAAILEPLLEQAENNLVVAIDCEGVSLGRFGPLTQVQLATMDGNVCIFDVYKNRALLQSGHLKRLLENKKIIKVIHDCREDSAALKEQFGVQLKNVFDTSVAHSTIMEQCNKVGGPFRIGLKALCDTLGEQSFFKDDTFKDKMLTTPDFWKQRPLTTEMNHYAAADTAVLVPHIYQAMNEMINPFWREYFNSKCEEALSAL